jgi:SAM-dependent methyltransferase
MTRRYDLHMAMAMAETHKGLGRPIPQDVRFRWLKSLEMKLTKILVFRQIRFNEAVVDALHHLRMAAEGNVIAPETRDQFVQQHEGISALRRDMVALQLQLIENQTRLEEAEGAQRRTFGQVDVFLNEVRRSMPDAPAAADLARQPEAWDRLYNAFEDLQRGSYDEIQKRLEVYVGDLPNFDEPVVDIGCGRGEWIELLRQKGIPSYGVDNNPEVATRAAARGLDVRTENGLDHLRAVGERSLSAVTAFHVAEHLPLSVLIELIDLSLRALRPGGKLILETPNPANLSVGSTTFWLDPTHVRPLPSDLLSFLVQSRGFTDVEVRPLSRSDQPVAPEQVTADTDPVVAQLVQVVNRHLGAAADYAVLGTRL